MPTNRNVLCSSALAATATLALSVVALAQADDGVAAARRATVSLRVQTTGGQTKGSGFIASQDGIVVTASHVIRHAESAQVVLPSGQSLQVFGVLHDDPETDLAVIKVDATGLPSVRLGDSDSVRVGQRLIAIGSPLGLELTVSDGVLSSLRAVGARRLLQISIPVSPGSSGGPVVTEQGLVVGVVVEGIRGGDAENLNFALPISYVREILPLVSQNQPRALRTFDSSVQLETSEWNGPDTVNDSLRLDWAALDGTSQFVQRDVSRTLRSSEETFYSTSVDPSGAPTVERSERTTVSVSAGGLLSTWSEAYRDDIRVVVPLRPRRGQGIEVYGQRTSTVPQVLSGTVQVTITDESAAGQITGMRPWRTRVPRGVLPLSLVNAAIAALPDSLPRVVFIWALAVDSTGARVVPVKVQFGSPTTTKVRFARNAPRCGPATRTEARTMKVVPVTVTTGANTDEHWVLSAKPHLPVYQGIGCIGLSGARP